MIIRKKFLSGREPLLDNAGIWVGWRMACTVWEGDDRDPSGMTDLGTKIIEIRTFDPTLLRIAMNTAFDDTETKHAACELGRHDFCQARRP